MTRAATSLKMPQSLKKRVDALARKTGQTTHAWMLQALEEHASSVELRLRFYEEGREALEQSKREGYTYSLESVVAHNRAKLKGKPSPGLKKIKWR